MEITSTFLTLFLCLFFLQSHGLQPTDCSATPFPAVSDFLVGAPSICAYNLYNGELNGSRSLYVASNNDILVVEQGSNQIRCLWDGNDDGLIDASTESAVIARADGINHGIEVSTHFNFLFASSPTTLYRWNYTPGARSDLGQGTIIIQNIPCCHHVTRTLRFDNDETWLYVQSGSASNVDLNATHAMIRRFPQSVWSGTSAVDWTTGDIWAVGLRNEIALRFDQYGKLWGVENGIDDVERADWNLTFNLLDIHDNNPCEELNLLTNPGKFYGYPFCWSEGILPSPPGLGAGTQWFFTQEIFPTTPGPFTPAGVYSDVWCQNVNNVIPPRYCFPAHGAPMDIIFDNEFPYTNTAWNMTAFISFHGSWDKTPPSGHSIVQVGFDATASYVVGVVDFLQLSNLTNFRPVGLAMWNGPWGRSLLVADDEHGRITSVIYAPPPPTEAPPPTPSPSSGIASSSAGMSSPSSPISSSPISSSSSLSSSPISSSSSSPISPSSSSSSMTGTSTTTPPVTTTPPTTTTPTTTPPITYSPSTTTPPITYSPSTTTPPITYSPSTTTPPITYSPSTTASCATPTKPPTSTSCSTPTSTPTPATGSCSSTSTPTPTPTPATGSCSSPTRTPKHTTMQPAYTTTKPQTSQSCPSSATPSPTTQSPETTSPTSTISPTTTSPMTTYPPMSTTSPVTTSPVTTSPPTTYPPTTAAPGGVPSISTIETGADSTNSTTNSTTNICHYCPPSNATWYNGSYYFNDSILLEGGFILSWNFTSNNTILIAFTYPNFLNGGWFGIGISPCDSNDTTSNNSSTSQCSIDPSIGSVTVVGWTDPSTNVMQYKIDNSTAIGVYPDGDIGLIQKSIVVEKVTRLTTIVFERPFVVNGIPSIVFTGNGTRIVWARGPALINPPALTDHTFAADRYVRFDMLRGSAVSFGPFHSLLLLLCFALLTLMN